MKRLILVSLALVAMIAINRCGGDDNNPVPKPGDKNAVQIGSAALPDTTYSWSPVEGLSDPKVSNPWAAPRKSTVYTVTATTKCGKADDQVSVKVFKVDKDGQLIEVVQ